MARIRRGYSRCKLTVKSEQDAGSAWSTGTGRGISVVDGDDNDDLGVVRGPVLFEEEGRLRPSRAGPIRERNP